MQESTTQAANLRHHGGQDLRRTRERLGRVGRLLIASIRIPSCFFFLDHVRNTTHTGSQQQRGGFQRRRVVVAFASQRSGAHSLLDRPSSAGCARESELGAQGRLLCK